MSQSPETFSNKKLLRAAKLTCGVVILAFGWWGLSGVGKGQAASKSDAAPGRVEGGGEVLSLGTSATGTIAELLVKTGDHVQAGQHLLRVECRNIEREIEARELDLAASEAVFARVTHGSRPEEIAIGVANVNLAEARLREAEKQFQRAQTLHEGVTVTRVQIDQAERTRGSPPPSSMKFAPSWCCCRSAPAKKTSPKRARGATPPKNAWKKP